MSPFEYRHCVSFTPAELARLAADEAAAGWAPAARPLVGPLLERTGYHPRQVGTVTVSSAHGDPVLGWQNFFPADAVPLADSETVRLVEPSGKVVVTAAFAEISLAQIKAHANGHFWVREPDVFLDDKCWSLPDGLLAELDQLQRAADWLSRGRAAHQDGNPRAKPKKRNRFALTVAHPGHLPGKYPHLGFASVVYPDAAVATRPDAELIAVLDERRELVVQQRLGEFAAAEIQRFFVDHFWVTI